MKLKDSNTEVKIMEAAKVVFMKYGLYGARMQDIADTAGINKALLHYYYRNKEKLFDQVFDGALSKYFEQMDVISDDSMPIIDRIHIYIDRMMDFLSEYPQMSMFIIKEISINPDIFKAKVYEIRKGKGATILTILEEGKKTGQIPADLDSVIFMINLHSLCTYPFLASPIFKVISEKSKMNWKDPQNNKLKQSVKDFVTFKLTIPQ
jgi:AcrR family transcriptional regulator